MRKAGKVIQQNPMNKSWFMIRGGNTIYFPMDLHLLSCGPATQNAQLSSRPLLSPLLRDGWFVLGCPWCLGDWLLSFVHFSLSGISSFHQACRVPLCLFQNWLKNWGWLKRGKQKPLSDWFISVGKLLEMMFLHGCPINQSQPKSLWLHSFMSAGDLTINTEELKTCWGHVRTVSDFVSVKGGNNQHCIFHYSFPLSQFVPQSCVDV